MMLIVNRYTTIIHKHGLRYVVRQIWLGSIVLGLIHAGVFWYAQYQIGEWGDRMAAVARAFENRETLWNGVSVILGFPLCLIESSGFAHFGLMVVNSILWGVVASLLVVPAIVKK